VSAYQEFKRDLFWCLVVYFLLNALFSWLRIGFDETDNHHARARSGLGLHVDQATGCQYLSTATGGITPRLDAAGRHLCGRRP